MGKALSNLMRTNDMALSNRDRVDRMFQILAPALDDFISAVVGQAEPSLGADWTKLVQAKDLKNGVPAGKTYDPLDPQMQFRILTESNTTGGYRQGWYPFNQALGKAGESYAIELREVRNSWAHNGTFTDDDAYRSLDTGERLLKLVGAMAEAAEVQSVRLNLRRVAADKDDKKVLKAAVTNPEASGLKPWREVLQPRDDVATGNFHASEFAADLYKVATGGEVDLDYADPVEFFKRTYLTEGLRDLIGRALRRFTGDENSSPVINLQTNFGAERPTPCSHSGILPQGSQ
ncbi:Swt1 family HEPN domain-containing protein [Arthrobacter alpinus]|nr:Swt1 family HEPN domain-containing protein [Arthrobacter alpinus]